MNLRIGFDDSVQSFGCLQQEFQLLVGWYNRVNIV